MPYSRKEALLCLFDRPTEYIFMPKGPGNSVIFDVPDGYVADRYRGIRKHIVRKLTKKGCKTIPVKNISLPDLTVATKLGLKEYFSLFIPKHLEIAENLIEIFMNERSLQDLISVAAYCHDRVNPYLFNYALSVALLHRDDTKEVQLPNYLQCFPGKFVESKAFGEARQEVAIVPKEVREPVILVREFTANAKEPEQAISYFREDIGINLHHWHWHLVYPFGGGRRIVDKDRRGELFYYMHQQILARYNAERISNGLTKVKSFENLREAIQEGYFPKLTMQIASQAWPPRFVNTPLSNLDRSDDGLVVNITDVELWMKNLKEAIEQGFVVNRAGAKIQLTEVDGIDILGNAVEASSLSPNRALYGNIHNMGHVLISGCHDPDGRFLEPFAVMSDTTTAMRDPIFYRWHNYINSAFVSHKDKLPKYTADQLLYKNVCVTDVQVTINNKPPNQLLTFWEQSDIDISRGLDFAPRSPIFFRFPHLQHEEFSFVVKVNNTSTEQLLGTLRLFMAPRNNESGVAMPYDEQRKMMIELDKFRVTLKPGENTITRKSLDSSVTIPYERTFRNLDTNRPPGDNSNDPALYAFNFCGCGWPQHMLIPRGTTNGMLFDLFAIVSDYNNDKIEQDVTGTCNDADSYCGIQSKKYPDKQSMGYPFDRVGRDGVTNLADFLTLNMKVQEITVKFEDRTVIRNQPPVVNISVVPTTGK